MTPTPTRRTIARLALLLPLLAACGPSDIKPQIYPPPTYDYLTKLQLNVAAIDIDDSWQPRNPKADIAKLAPTPPADALRIMAQDRLIPAGTTGHATFVIDEASIEIDRGRYEGRMRVHLDVATSEGTNTGYAEARISRSREITNPNPNATRAALHDLIDAMMADMNVELEFQIRRSLRAYIKDGTPAPTAKPVETEALPAPP